MKPTDRLRHVADLEWYCNESDGDLGLHAQNYDPDRWRGGSPDPEKFGVSRAAAADRFRRVHAAVMALTADDHRVLRLAYTDHRWRGLERWGREAGVACWLYDREDVIDAGLALQTLMGQKGAEGWLEEHRRKAAETLRVALAAYVLAEAAVVAQREADKAGKRAADRRLAEQQGRKFVAPVEEE